MMHISKAMVLALGTLGVVAATASVSVARDAERWLTAGEMAGLFGGSAAGAQDGKCCSYLAACDVLNASVCEGKVPCALTGWYVYPNYAWVCGTAPAAAPPAGQTYRCTGYENPNGSQVCRKKYGCAQDGQSGACIQGSPIGAGPPNNLDPPVEIDNDQKCDDNTTCKNRVVPVVRGS